MKIFQIVNGVCHADFSSWENIDSIPSGTFPKKLINQLVEAPDYVFIDWLYSRSSKKFTRMIIPEGYSYHSESGTIYPTGKDIIAIILRNEHREVYLAVQDGLISPEVFLTITKQEYIPISEDE